MDQDDQRDHAEEAASQQLLDEQRAEAYAEEPDATELVDNDAAAAAQQTGGWLAHVDHLTAPAVIQSFSGADVLVRRYGDDVFTVAFRSGADATGRRWSPETTLEVAP